MKKVINGKSYNTEYDSEFICKYNERIDGWAATRYYIYRKKSSGEYFEYKKWSDWNDGWDIDLISEKDVEKVVKEVKSGMTHKYCAVMANFPGTRSKGYYWGTADDDPWLGKKVKEKKEQEKKELEKKRNQVMEERMREEAAGKKTWGVMEITGCSEGNPFKRIYDKEVPADKVGKVLYHKVNLRIRNSDFDKEQGFNGWYKHCVYVILEGNNKALAKDIVKKTIEDVVKEMGEFDAVMKGVELVEFTAKNRERRKEIDNRIEKMNKKIIWGEE